MAFWIPLAVGVGTGALVSLLTGMFGGSKKEAEQETQQQVRVQQPTGTIIYPKGVYAPTTTYSPDYQYQPVVIIGSPHATATPTAVSKKEIEQKPEVSPQLIAMPQVIPYQKPTIEQPTETSTTSELMPLILVGGGLGLLYLLLK